MSSGKTLITGNPHSGTTFMVGLLHRLGHNTGYSDERVDAVLKGLEWLNNGNSDTRRDVRIKWRLHNEDSTPPVVKIPFTPKPARNNITLDFIESYEWELDAVILMIRPMDKIKEVRPEADLDHMRKQLTMFLEAAVTEEWPVVMAHFPRVVDDAEYCHRVLGDLAPPFKEFYPIWEKHRRPDEVHAR